MIEYVNSLPPWVVYTVLAIFGLILGSFLNVCIFRLPREKSVVVPRSFCPKCRTPIRLYDNIPLFSYLFLGGKCRECKRHISIQYPLVEIISAFFSFYVYYVFDDWLSYLVYYILLIAPLIVITFIDLEHKIIPDVISLPGILIGALVHFTMMHGKLSTVLGDIFFGILVGGGFLALVGLSYEWLKKREGLGGGDVKLAAMLGAFFGWKGIIFILLASSVLGSLIGIILIVVFKKGTKYAIPYGPFLAMAAVIYLFWGEWILNWYLGFYH